MLYRYDGAPYRSAYSRNGTKAKRATAAELDSYGESVLAGTKTVVNRYDPDGTKLKFAFITDLHRSEDGIYTSNPIDDRYSLRLLSRICDEVNLDAVFCGGDITNARDENAEYFQKNMADVVSDLDSYCPYTPIYATIGNHDKRYSTSRPNTTNAQLKAIWSPVYANGNGVELHYVDDTNFYVDFTKHKVRIIFINQYDRVDENANWYANENISSATGIHTRGSTNWKAALPTDDKAEWMVGVVFHGADNSVPTNPDIRNFTYTDLLDTLQAYVDGGGRGSLGAIAGHYHQKNDGTIQPSLNIIHVANAYAEESQLNSTSEYCLSIFIIDPQTGLFNECRRGRGATSVPFCAYFGQRGNNGLLQNGTHTPYSDHAAYYCVYDGNHVHYNYIWDGKNYLGMNYTNLDHYWGFPRNDFVSDDTANVLFSAKAGDIIRTEIEFSDGTPTTNKPFKIFSPQISSMVSGTVVSGAKYTNEITLAEDTNVTAIGMSYNGVNSSATGEFDFELNIYKNGVKLTRSV